MGRKICATEGCEKTRFCRGLCRSCYSKGMRAGVLPPLPPRRPATGTCGVEGCEKSIRGGAKGICPMHTMRLRRHGSLDAPTPKLRQGDLLCTVEGCEEKGYRRRMCSVHYRRWARHGSTESQRAEPRKGCSVEGCERPHKGRGLCEKHYNAQRPGRTPAKAKPDSRKYREDWKQDPKKTPRVVLERPKPALATVDFGPVRWPAEESPEACVDAIHRALLRCSNDTREARRMLGVDLLTWDKWFHLTRKRETA